ncbi:hypothetical protein BUALT_Bualt07G0005000 [Buddleja alternifolia]|uniref:Uncharacterized protein n=1 Tax=Buddleja alternifolia TaxID=168488 RepID=A0AAV6X663_9LAMI|nr:hypothetical protein BUALT_Bualt07G0005000 [Buddleja alternifolia]
MEDAALESSSQIVRRMEKGSHELLVENYSLCKGIGVSKAIESKEFTVGGHQWTIRFYPDGQNDDANKKGNTYIAVCLKSESRSPVQFLSELYLLDQSSKGNHQGGSLFKDASPKQIDSITCGKMSGYLVKRAFLKHSDYLRGDCLKIHCTIGVLTTGIQELRGIEVPESTIATDFGNLLESKEGADVFFKVADESFCAHKCILAARSPFFWSYFSDYHEDQEMVIPDMEPRVFKAMLWFIYTGIFLEEKQETFLISGPFIVKSFLGKMLAAADQFHLKKLKNICESCILERLSGESVAYILHLAELCNATELKVACLKFIAENQAGTYARQPLLAILLVRNFLFLSSFVVEYLEETCPLLFLELARYKDNAAVHLELADYEENPVAQVKLVGYEGNPVRQLSTNRKRDIVVTFKDYFVGRYRRLCAKVKQRKRKDL